jgi:hypothetical protein
MTAVVAKRWLSDQVLVASIEGPNNVYSSVVKQMLDQLDSLLKERPRPDDDPSHTIVLVHPYPSQFSREVVVFRGNRTEVIRELQHLADELRYEIYQEEKA